MYAPADVKTSRDFPIPDTMKAWVLGGPGELTLKQKPVPVPKKAEVLVRIDAVAICATDLENIYHGPPAMIEGGPPFNKNWTPGHEYMGTVVALGPGVDEYLIGERVAWISTATRSPVWYSATPGPSATTVPMYSCPGVQFLLNGGPPSIIAGGP